MQETQHTQQTATRTAQNQEMQFGRLNAMYALAYPARRNQYCTRDNNRVLYCPDIIKKTGLLFL